MRPRSIRRSIPAVLLGLVAVTAHAGAPASARPASTAPSPIGLVEAEAPPFSEGIFPCSACHASLEKNGARRELAFHDEQQSVFSHDAEHRWCLDCHDLQDRDVLRLASGATVPFTESYRLCGQCHGDKSRDWRAGVHGKRVGRWDGAKTYFLCVNCHDPHSPRFKGVREIVSNGKRTVAPTRGYLKPEPRPVRPEEQRR
ncbi:hypothetical protein [Anaeromyxobacter oryzisoli]|uniref:hypothetical protein n=1 Tax=Anaeromyxobacter oryzisoli TaxID=2925408 RepID=UPI001F57CCC1|nr:hypothetical protein [Anaeromyxobacter sp. SG63]